MILALGPIASLLSETAPSCLKRLTSPLSKLLFAGVNELRRGCFQGFSSPRGELLPAFLLCLPGQGRLMAAGDTRPPGPACPGQCLFSCCLSSPGGKD